MVALQGVFSAILLAAVSHVGLHSAFAAEKAIFCVVIKMERQRRYDCRKSLHENADSDNDPFHRSRMYAMMRLIAIHDALNAIDRRYQPYAYDTKAALGTSPDAAIAAAARDVLDKEIAELPAYIFKVDCINAGRANVEAAYKAAIGAISDTPAKKQGIALGREAAAAIIARRAGDNSDGQFINKDCPKPEPGKYQCTPGFPFVAFEAWEKVSPFTLKEMTQFRPGPPYAITDARFTDDLNEVKKLGGDGKTTPSARTADQTQIALFWFENSPLKWSRIARTVATEKGLGQWENARLFALLNMALADEHVAMRECQRLTTTSAASGRKRSNTGEDTSWTPLLPTPPDQDYPSGHSIEGGVGAGVLRRVLGTDQITFKDCGTTLPAGSRCDDPTPAMRTYAVMLHGQADENAYSRVLHRFPLPQCDQGRNGLRSPDRRAGCYSFAARPLRRSVFGRLFYLVEGLKRMVGCPPIPLSKLVPMPHKHNADRRHHIPKMSFKVQNWPAYAAGLRRRGSLFLWIEDGVLDHWQTCGPDGQARCTDAAIQTSLMLRAAFKELPLRQTEACWPQCSR